jgi:hypothetical protein
MYRPDIDESGRALDQLGDGNILRQLDTLGGGNILRQLDNLGDGNILRQLDTLGGGNILRQLDQLGNGNILRESRMPVFPYGHLSYGRNKKNFDEIDRTGFGRFVKRPMPVKKNFDEIDNVGFRSLYSF